MPLFRKKPVVVEAYRFDEAECWDDVVVGSDLSHRYPGVRLKRHDTPHVANHFVVVTAHGQEARVADGDWVVSEPDGRGHYPCKPDIFAATYEPAG